MPHNLTLLSTITAAFVCAAIFGMLAVRLRMPPLVGYLVAGVALGPFTPGFVGDASLAGELAEVGVILLMFGVGLHFSVSDLMAVRRIAIPGAVVQIAIATAIGVGMAMTWGWSWGAGLMLGLSVSVASTVVLLKALEERGSVAGPDARIAIGWLIVEDLAMILALVLLPAFAESMGGHVPSDGYAPAVSRGLAMTVAVTLGKVGIFIALLLLIIVAKTVAAVGIVLLLGYPWRTALMVGASLAQIGEFSFILGGLGVRYAILPPKGLSLILAGALFSITLNTLAFAVVDFIVASATKNPRWRDWFGNVGAARFTQLEESLEAARTKTEQAAAHKLLSPVELATRFPLFVSLTLDQREVLALHFHSQSAQPGEQIVRAGDRADAVYFISSGSIQAVFGDQTFSLGAGEYFGEIELIRGRPRLVDVTAVDYTELLALDRRDFRMFLRKYPELRTQINQLADEREEMVRPFLDSHA